MARYIDADALLKEWKIELPKKRPVKGEYSKEVLTFMKKYENHPYYFAILSVYFAESADVVEVVHGQWTDTTHGLICSACKTYQVYGSRFYHFCPICGAKMDGQPTADVVEVIRCKDCKWYGIDELKKDGSLDRRYKPSACYLYREHHEESWYCADAERRTE